VDYREKLYAVARIPSTYNKREGNPKEHELLAGRRIGRALRPLFPKGFALDSAVRAGWAVDSGPTHVFCHIFCQRWHSTNQVSGLRAQRLLCSCCFTAFSIAAAMPQLAQHLVHSRRCLPAF
jgi:hypothetical protein